MCLLAQGFRSSSRSVDVVLHVGNVVDLRARMSVDTEVEKSRDEVHVLCGKVQPIVDCRELFKMTIPYD